MAALLDANHLLMARYARRAYGSLSGQFAALHSDPDAAGLAAWDEQAGVARVLVGAFVDPTKPPPQQAPSSVQLRLRNLPPRLRVTKLSARITHILDTEINTPGCTPAASAECFPPPAVTSSLLDATGSSDIVLQMPLTPNASAGYCSVGWKLEFVSTCSDAWLVELNLL